MTYIKKRMTPVNVHKIHKLLQHHYISLYLQCSEMNQLSVNAFSLVCKT